MDAAFVIVLAVALGLLSVLIGVRLAAGGASRRQVAGPVIELWVVFALWVSIFALVRSVVGEPTGASWRGELADLVSRLSALEAGAKCWLGLAIAVGVAGCLHLLVRLRQAMGVHQLEVTGGKP